MCARLLLIIAAFLLGQSDGLAQGRHSKMSNWGFQAGAWLLWNTVHGDRYMPPRPVSPGIPLRDVDPTRWRSFAHNSFSPAIGVLTERRLYRSLWMAGGLEFVDRKWQYVFDEDTLGAYPPGPPIPFGLYYKSVVEHRYNIEIPLAVEYVQGPWTVAIGTNAVLFQHVSVTRVHLDGTRETYIDYSGRTDLYLNPRLWLGYRPVRQRIQGSIGVDLRKWVIYDKRWVDIRFGVGIRIARVAM